MDFDKAMQRKWMMRMRMTFARLLFFPTREIVVFDIKVIFPGTFLPLFHPKSKSINIVKIKMGKYPRGL
jgi:hypothetical protein